MPLGTGKSLVSSGQVPLVRRGRLPSGVVRKFQVFKRKWHAKSFELNPDLCHRTRLLVYPDGGNMASLSRLESSRKSRYRPRRDKV